MTTATNGHRLTLTQGEWGRERHGAREIGGERDRRQKRPVVRETSGERDQWSGALKILQVEKRISGDIGEIKEIFSMRLNIC